MKPQRSLRLLWGTCLVLAFFTCSVVVSAQIEPPINVYYNVAAEVVYTDNNIARSFASAQAQCMESGFNLFSSESARRIQRVWLLATRTISNPVDYSTYTSLSARKTATNTRCTYTNTPFRPPNSLEPNPFFCTFTIQWGLFSRHIMQGDYGNQPGLNIYQCVFPTFLNSNIRCGSFLPWTSGLRWDTGVTNPNGQNYTLITTNQALTQATLVNIGPVAPADFYRPVSKFLTACEAQISVAYPPQTFNATQPSFLLGYKELTWVQRHWWVLFTIIAAIILIVLFMILIFCCVTSAPPKVGPPIAPMVLRERNGPAYVNASDDDSTPKTRDLGAGSMRPGGNSSYGFGLRQGSGMLPAVDPEDMMQATPSIYSQEDILQTAEGDSVMSQDDRS
ncbi:hypothetical protein ABL78_0613 [Leptomonas seymouri]|uniref:Uncharacterized protein n=1 Tax=Leptomonas seymouri TaxID=5684 RepID=A0A0N1I9Y8_LEPSE|nr:hypothetical protein ABL78_0613 [Leptomonas seymouri]|eukprot:KPI90231.1 hypothetical protein ABL78_0613 [Leptomonas seymouri]